MVPIVKGKKRKHFAQGDIFSIKYIVSAWLHKVCVLIF